MISENFDINDFVAKTQNSSLDDFIALSIREATTAERFYWKHRNDATLEGQKIREYIQSIKALINYARYESTPKNEVNDTSIAVLEQIKAKSHNTFV
jgi:hypothetical protein